MWLRLHELALPYDEDPARGIPRLLAERLGESARLASEWRVFRRSVDARSRPVKIVYGVDVALSAPPEGTAKGAGPVPAEAPLEVPVGKRPLDGPPVVVGAGPAGLFAALLLAEHGFRPIVLERGGTVAERRLALSRFRQTRVADPEINALFGLGGAGTFSDGKLTTGLNHPWLGAVLRILVDCGAPQGILVEAKPHIGTDVLGGAVEALRGRIERAGGIVRTGERMERLALAEGRVTGVVTSRGALDAGVVVLAIGHSARDTWASLAASGVALAAKAFQMGIRVEHPQAWLDAARYGEAAGHAALGAADYKLTARVEGTPVFSFCMCPGGETMATASEPSHLALNGMSASRRDSPFASSGLVVTLGPSSSSFQGLEPCLALQRQVERACFAAGGSDFTAPAQRLVDFARGEASARLPASSYALGVAPARLDRLLPAAMATPLRRALPVFDERLPGYLHAEALALAPESRASSPVRIVRDRATWESTTVSGLYPVGEGAGYAGGIMSSALDGLMAASRIIGAFAPPR